MKKASALVLACVIAASLTVPAFASNFTPSVEQKEAPSVVTVKDEKGNEVAAIIKDKDGNEVVGVGNFQLTVTPASKSENAAPEVKEKMEKAHEQIKNAKDLTALSPDLESHLEKISDKGVKAKDLVVRDLFDVSLTGDAAEELAKSGNSISITFQMKLKKDALLVVMHNYEGDKWEVIPEDHIVRHPNGDVTVTFDSLSPVAFLVDAAEVAVDPAGPSSPQTGEGTPVYAVLGMALCAAAAAYFVVNSKKKA